MIRSPVPPALQRRPGFVTPVLPVHLLRYRVVTAELANLRFRNLGVSGGETVKAPGEMEVEGPVLSPLGGDVNGRQQVSDTATTPTDTESGIFPGEGDLCVEHEAELDWFCGTEQKIVCSQCTVVGPCQGHTVTPLAERVTAVRVSILNSDVYRIWIGAIAFKTT